MDRAANLNLSPTAQQALVQEADRLGEASVPESVAAERETAVATAIDHAFVDTFQTVMVICAGLAWLAAGTAVWLIKDESAEKSQRRGAEVQSKNNNLCKSA